MYFNNKNQKGSSLLEMLAVLTIISLVGIAAIKFVTNSYGVFKQSMATSEIKELQNIISKNYSFTGKYDFGTDINKKMCEEDKTAPSHMCLKSGENYILKHRLGGYITVLKESVDSRSYSIAFDNVNKRACVALTQVDWLERKKISIYQMDVNGVVAAYFPKKDNKGFPLTSEESMKICNSDINTVKWYFY